MARVDYRTSSPSEGELLARLAGGFSFNGSKSCNVTVCLPAGWETKTVSGEATVVGQVGGYRRSLGSRRRPSFYASIIIDDSQFSIDPGTGEPYVFDDCICGIKSEC